MCTFIEEFSDFMSVISNITLDTLILTGYFNVHFETSDKSSRDLNDLLLEHGLRQLVQDATQEDGHTVDLVFANPYELSLTMNVKRDYACTNNPNIKFDHYPVFFDVPLTDTGSVNQSQTN